MVSEKMGLPFYRRGGRGGRGPVHNTNFLEKWLFSIIYFEKTIQSIFMKFSGFVYYAKDYCCASFRNQQSFLKCCKSLYFYIVDAGIKKKKKGCVWVQALASALISSKNN